MVLVFLQDVLKSVRNPVIVTIDEGLEVLDERRNSASEFLGGSSVTHFCCSMWRFWITEVRCEVQSC